MVVSPFLEVTSIYATISFHSKHSVPESRLAQQSAAIPHDFITIHKKGLLSRIGLLILHYAFTTLHEQSGQGIYRYDIALTPVGYRAADAVTLVLALPLLIISILLYRRSQLRGGLLLTGILAYFLYTYGSMAFGISSMLWIPLVASVHGLLKITVCSL